MSATPHRFQTVGEALRHARNMDAPLEARLAVVAEAIRALRPAYADAVDRLVARLDLAGSGRASPDRGTRMPRFLMPDETGRLLGLGELLDRGPAIIAFHRGHWCPFCRTNLSALAAAADQLAPAQVVAVTPDKRDFNARLKADAGADFPILSDVDNGYALSLGLAFWLGDELAQLLSGMNVDPPACQGNDHWMLPIPATFVVDRRGVVVARFLDPDFRRRASIEDLAAAVAALERP
jgi:peroxiredoxin